MDLIIAPDALILFSALFFTVAFLIFFLRQNARLESELEQYKSLALTDVLTGMPNRRGFEERADQVLASVKRDYNNGKDAVCSLVMVDLSKFKTINDTLGHTLGDMALTTFADILRRRLRASDVYGRVGGDEFAVLCLGAHYHDVRNVMWRVRTEYEDAIRQLFAHNALERPADVTFAFGIAEWTPERSERSTLLELADTRLYEDKRAGGVAVRICSLPRTRKENR